MASGFIAMLMAKRTGVVEPERIAVGRRRRGLLGGDHAADARHVLDDERLAEHFAQACRRAAAPARPDCRRAPTRQACERDASDRPRPRTSARPATTERQSESHRAMARDPNALSGMFLPGSFLFHVSPQMSRASSQTSSSLRSCASGVTGLPVSTLAKPHCGLTASRSSVTNLAASSRRRRSAVLFSSSGTLVETRPSTTDLCSGTKRSGVKCRRAACRIRGSRTECRAR